MLFCFNDTSTTEIYTYRHTLALHDALPIYARTRRGVEHHGRSRARHRAAMPYQSMTGISEAAPPKSISCIVQRASKGCRAIGSPRIHATDVQFLEHRWGQHLGLLAPLRFPPPRHVENVGINPGRCWHTIISIGKLYGIDVRDRPGPASVAREIGNADA